MTHIIADISMPLDGYVAGPEPTQQDPRGQGGERLHEWACVETAASPAVTHLRYRVAA
jgi:hypothetical protein